MRSLWHDLSPDQRGAWAETSAELLPHLLKGMKSGDAIMIKGSFGSRMGPLVDALRRKFHAIETSVDAANA